jgi:hypothetical protein
METDISDVTLFFEMLGLSAGLDIVRGPARDVVPPTEATPSAA